MLSKLISDSNRDRITLFLTRSYLIPSMLKQYYTNITFVDLLLLLNGVELVHYGVPGSK